MGLIEEGAGVWYESFATGQAGGSSNYFDYSDDLDTNFATARVAINILDERIGAVGGANALIPLRVMALNDENGPQVLPPEITDSEWPDCYIGSHSYIVAVGSPTTEADITKGQMIMQSNFVEQTSSTTLSGVGISAGAQDHYFSVDVHGVISVSDTSGVRDFATLYWDNAKYTGTMTRLIPVGFDGDAWRQMQEVPASLIFPAGVYDEPGQRILAIERILSGYDTDSLGTAIGPISFPYGAAGDPQVCFGAAGVANSAGWYRTADDEWAFTDGSSQVFRFTDEGIRFAIDGAAATPTVVLGDDTGTGIYSKASHIIGMATNTNECVELNAAGQLELALQRRTRAIQAGDSLSSSTTPTAVTFDSAPVNVGAMWAGGAPTRITIVETGWYSLIGWVEFIEGGTGANTNTRGVFGRINGTIFKPFQTKVLASSSGNTTISFSMEYQMTAADYFEIAVMQDSGDSMTFDAQGIVSRKA